MAEHYSASEIGDNANGQEDQQGKIRASHLLVKHKGSRRPSSWREVRILNDPNSKSTINDRETSMSRCARGNMTNNIIGRNYTHKGRGDEHYSSA